MIEMLQELARCGRPWAEQTGQHQAGAISDEEYAELMMDLVRADRLDQEADDLDTKSMLVTSCMVLAKVI